MINDEHKVAAVAVVGGGLVALSLGAWLLKRAADGQEVVKIGAVTAAPGWQSVYPKSIVSEFSARAPGEVGNVETFKRYCRERGAQLPDDVTDDDIAAVMISLYVTSPGLRDSFPSVSADKRLHYPEETSQSGRVQRDAALYRSTLNRLNAGVRDVHVRASSRPPYTAGYYVEVDRHGQDVDRSAPK